MPSILCCTSNSHLFTYLKKVAWGLILFCGFVWFFCVVFLCFVVVVCLFLLLVCGGEGCLLVC